MEVSGVVVVVVIEHPDSVELTPGDEVVKAVLGQVRDVVNGLE